MWDPLWRENSKAKCLFQLCKFITIRKEYNFSNIIIFNLWDSMIFRSILITLPIIRKINSPLIMFTMMMLNNLKFITQQQDYQHSPKYHQDLLTSRRVIILPTHTYIIYPNINSKFRSHERIAVVLASIRLLSDMNTSGWPLVSIKSIKVPS